MFNFFFENLQLIFHSDVMIALFTRYGELYVTCCKFFSLLHPYLAPCWWLHLNFRNVFSL